MAITYACHKQQWWNVASIYLAKREIKICTKLPEEIIKCSSSIQETQVCSCSIHARQPYTTHCTCNYLNLPVLHALEVSLKCHYSSFSQLYYSQLATSTVCGTHYKDIRIKECIMVNTLLNVHSAQSPVWCIISSTSHQLFLPWHGSRCRCLMSRILHLLMAPCKHIRTTIT